MSVRRLLGGAVSAALLFGAACSDPVPPPSQGGLTIHIRSAPAGATPDGKSCQFNPHYAYIGSPPPGAGAPGSRVVDEESGASVKCAVRKSGDVFKVSASMSHKGVAFTVNGQLSPGGSGTATILHRNPTMLDTLQNPVETPCIIAVDVEPLQVATGRIWARFSCPGLISQKQPSTYCEADEGWFVLENCDE